MKATEVTIDGQKLRLTNLDKVLYPEAGFTKGQVLDYYRRIAPVLLPHLAGRALTLKRYPDGVGGMHFYEKRCPPYRPEWVQLHSVPREGGDGTIDYCVIEDLATLIWVANLASIELHVLMSTRKDYHRPTTMVFDFDPGPPAGLLDAARVALRVRDMLKEFDLEAFPKTSGGKGIHLYVPLNTPVTYAETGEFAHALAQLLEKEQPTKIVSKMSKSLRKGKVFVDWSQNAEHKTTVAPYSLRARPRPTVSTPVTWEEIETAVQKKKADLLVFEADDVLKRVEKLGDLMAPALKLKQRLPMVPAE
mgnify:CR=1 FL=1